MSGGSSFPAALVTGASTGIGATYADRLARRGHALVLVARDTGKLERLAAELRATYGVTVDILPADLTVATDLARVEARLRTDERIGLLVNNAGAAIPGGLGAPDLDVQEDLIKLNVTSVARLSAAALPGFLARGEGAIVNIASVLAFATEFSTGLYAATKAFVLTLSQSYRQEFADKGLYVQAVLPAATRTDIWKKSGVDVDQMSGVMDVGEMVDAALVGFDRREPVTLPSLVDMAQWEAYEDARKAMLPNIAREHAAERYRHTLTTAG